MLKDNLYEPFSISLEKFEKYPNIEKQHNFFELVYVLSGKGKICINNNFFDYQKEDLILLTPYDFYSFKISNSSNFFLISFSDVYIELDALHTDDVEKLHIILKNANTQLGSLLKTSVDKNLVKAIVNVIIKDFANNELYSKELIHNLIDSLIIIIAKNISNRVSEIIEDDTEEKIVLILNYIQTNIYYPKMLRTKTISKQFNISTNYLGKYFKSHCKETLQNYIAKCKMYLIEQRLIHSDSRISEIVSEFGFIDESHLNRFFKKRWSVSSTTFRRLMREV